MVSWQVTFISLMITAVLGLVLFSGYFFRIRMIYPLHLVTLHVLSATVTVGLFTIMLIQHTRHSSVHAMLFVWWSFGVVLLTFLSGLYFYFRFNMRNQILRTGLVALHLFLASMAFVFSISSIAELVPNNPQHYHPPSLYNYYKHHR